jgi:hypothetical protein
MKIMKLSRDVIIGVKKIHILGKFGAWLIILDNLLNAGSNRKDRGSKC